jgi:predicted RNA-binding protein with PUA-like domain
MGAHWLAKSEPETYSIDDLERDGWTSWDGVRNYQARNNMRAMKRGDLVLFYHSNAKPPGVIGVARVRTEAYPDPTAWNRRSKYFDPQSPKDNPRWDMVDLEFVEKFGELVSLDTLKTTRGLEQMVVTRRGRLSVQPVTKEEFQIVRRLGKQGRR